MLVERKVENFKELRDVFIGDAFIYPYDNCVYMKTDEKDSQELISCVRLSTGKIYYFTQTEEVNVSKTFKVVEV